MIDVIVSGTSIIVLRTAHLLVDARHPVWRTTRSSGLFR
jgi:hypothetical protein